MRTPRKSQKGIVLLETMVITMIIMMTLMMTVHESSEALKAGTLARKKALVKAAFSHGMDVAINELQGMDPSDFATMTNVDQWNIFLPVPGASFIQSVAMPLTYPPAGEYANMLTVNIGLVPGQKTQPPAGEDVSKAYGFIVDLQISVSIPANTLGPDPYDERRVIGVRIPHVKSGA